MKTDWPPIFHRCLEVMKSLVNDDGVEQDGSRKPRRTLQVIVVENDKVETEWNLVFSTTSVRLDLTEIRA